MKTLLIVYHTMTGGTQQMAQAAAAGAAEVLGVAAADGDSDAAALQLRMLRAPDAGPADVLAADGYVFATPEYLAGMAGLMKDFFDRCYYPVLDRIDGRPYAALVCAGSDGAAAARQIERITTGWRLRAVAPALIVCTRAQTPEQIGREKHLSADDLARCSDTGARLAAGMAAGIY